jgi:hypothetical protein
MIHLRTIDLRSAKKMPISAAAAGIERKFRLVGTKEAGGVGPKHYAISRTETSGSGSLIQPGQPLSPQWPITKTTRSDNKGSKPEGVAIARIGGTVYAFIALERIGGIMVYDITDPCASRVIARLSNG